MPGQVVRGPDQKVREIYAGLTSAELILSVFRCQVPLVDLVIVELSAELQCVRADHVRKVVQPLKGVVVLSGGDLGYANNEIVESKDRTPSSAGIMGLIPPVEAFQGFTKPRFGRP